ncbi:MAG: DUF5916 domain-containing protein [Lysobacterales bacterium]
MSPANPARARLGLALMLFCAGALAAPPEIKIDGHLDDAAWAGAQVFRDFVVVEPYTLTQPSYETEALLLSTPAGIVIGFRCRQPEGVPRLRARTPRDADIPGDRVNVFIDFNADGETGYNFTVALSGSTQDATITNENNFSPDWDGDWKHRVAETDEGWSAEFLLPWTVAPMRDSSAPRRTIAIMFDRVLGSTKERSGYPAASFRRPRFISEFAKVDIDQYQASVFHVFPYATASRDFVDTRNEVKGGADLYWKPSGDLQLTAALNPDFGQVEADELVVNFDAIETFFSDRRPFFTENQSLFDVRSTDGGQLIYTRRIGGPRDDNSGLAADIDVALKLNGSALGFNYGVLAAQESDYADDLGSLFLAQRLLRPGDQFSIGYLGTYADRPFLTRESSVHAIDASWRPDPRWTVAGQVIVSQIDLPDVNQSGSGAWARVDFAADAATRQQLELTHFDRQLDFNDVGFQRRPSLNEARWLWERQQQVEDPESSLRGRLQRARVTNRHNDSGDNLQSTLSLDYILQFRNGGEFLANAYLQSAGFDDLISRGNGLVRLPARQQYYAEYSAPRVGRWQLYLSGRSFQESQGGYGLEAGGQLSFFASNTLTAQISSYVLDSKDWLLWESDSLFGLYQRQQVSSALNLDWFPAAQHELRLKLQWLAITAQNPRAARIGASGQLRASNDALSDFSVNNFGVQIRYRWEFAPQSDLYVVYGRGGFVEEQGDRDLGDLLDDAFSLRDADQLLVKLRRRF